MRKQFGWLGDSNEYGGQPQGVKLTDKIETSTKFKYRKEVGEFTTFYADGENWGELWKPAADTGNPLVNGNMYHHVILMGGLVAYAADAPKTRAEIQNQAPETQT